MRVATSNAITQLATASASETVFRSFSGLTANNTANAVTFGVQDWNWQTWWRNG